MFYVFREALPVFQKLSHLSVNLSNFCWSSMPMLIKKAPNLKTLNIDVCILQTQKFIRYSYRTLNLKSSASCFRVPCTTRVTIVVQAIFFASACQSILS